MALGAHFNMELIPAQSRMRGKRMATAACDLNFFVFWMNALFHDYLFSIDA
jgi:hypothetical protein